MFLRQLVAGAAAATVGCSAPSSTTAPPCDLGQPIDRFEELEIVDESVTSDARASNASSGAWSFRHAIEQMTPAGTSSSDFVTTWLNEWVVGDAINGFPLDDSGGTRADAMTTVILCPWLQRTPSNQCDATCGTCTSRTLDLAQAPFRLIGIANRMDLRQKPDRSGPAGEGRFVYALVGGAADSPAAQPLAFTLILEYALPSSNGVAQWAQMWHGLGAYPFGESYNTALQAVTDAFSARGASAASQNGSALAQARTNESALFWEWQLRQFNLDSTGMLRTGAVQDTPAESLNGTEQLASIVQQGQNDVMSGQFVLPAPMEPGSIHNFIFYWTLPGVDPAVLGQFSASTCNGCHGNVNTAIDTAFHLSPFRAGTAKVSTFLNNPADPSNDELARRTTILETAYCTGQ